MRKSLLLITDAISFFRGEILILIKNQFYQNLQLLIQNLATFVKNIENVNAVNYAIHSLKNL